LRGGCFSAIDDQGPWELVMKNKSGSLSNNTYRSTSATEATSTSRRNVVIGATALGAAAMIASPAVAQVSQTQRITLSYYPWIKQGISAADLRAAVDNFARVLQEALGKTLTVELLPVMEIPDQLEDIKRPAANDVVARIGLLNPVGYALIRREPGIEGIAVIRRKIGAEVGPTYKAQLYVNWKTKITKVSEVRGHSIAFGSPQSTSNFLVPAIRLWEAKIHPLNGFNRVEFAGGHDTAALAVYEGRLEVGAGHDGAVLGLAGRRGYRDAGDVLVNIDWSDPIPSDPVVIQTSDAAVRKKVTDALLAIAKPKDNKSAGNVAIKGFWDTDEGFEPIAPTATITAEKYDALFAIMEKLGLRRDDMLRKT
jgi:ABC-type phosphate/phosphonate transport system substrate-binding protein